MFCEIFFWKIFRKKFFTYPQFFAKNICENIFYVR
jgi:hypothetical protein